MFSFQTIQVSELDRLVLSLLVTSQFKMLAPLNGQDALGSSVGFSTLKPEHKLLCGLGHLLGNWLCLPIVATLLAIIAPLPLGIQGIFALLILGNFVRLILATCLTKSPLGFRNIGHLCSRSVCDEKRDPESVMATSITKQQRANLNFLIKKTNTNIVKAITKIL
jgi:hypothetical protein